MRIEDSIKFDSDNKEKSFFVRKICKVLSELFSGLVADSSFWDYEAIPYSRTLEEYD